MYLPNFLATKGVSELDRILFIGRKLLPLCIFLDSLGFKRLYFIDDHRNVYDNPYYTRIKYIYGDKTNIHFPDSFFKVIFTENNAPTSEIQKYLSSEGTLVIVPKKRHNFPQIGVNAINAENFVLYFTQRNPREATIKEKDISISTLVTSISARPNNAKVLPPSLDILNLSTLKEGISIYSEILNQRLLNEFGIKSQIIQSPSETRSDVVVFEFHKGLGFTESFFDDLENILSSGRKMIIESHSTLDKWKNRILRLTNRGAFLTMRANEIALYDGLKNYFLLPHLSYPEIERDVLFRSSMIKLGTFGFYGNQKGIDDIVSLGKKLQVSTKILLSINPIEKDVNKKSTKIRERFGKLKFVSVVSKGEKHLAGKDKIVEIIYGFFSDEEIVREMSGCSHIVFAHRSRLEQSGTINYAKKFGKPVFALDSFQAKIGQVYRFKKFTFLTPFRAMRDNLVEATLNYLIRKRNISRFLNYLEESCIVFLTSLLSAKKPTVKELNKLDFHEIRDEDGLDYLISLIKSI